MAREFHFEMTQTAKAFIALFAVCILGTLVLSAVLAPQGTAGALVVIAFAALATLCVGLVAIDKTVQAGVMWEWHTKRIYKAVALAKGLTKKDNNGNPVYPPFTRLMGNDRAFSATIRPLFGQSLADFEKAAEAFSQAYGSLGVRFSDNGDGSLTMKAGYQPLDEVTASVRSLHLEDGRSWRERLAAIPVAVTEGGRPFTLPAIDTHLLVVGESGAGKGSVIWSQLIGLVPGIKAGVVRVWGLDPKRVELSIGRGFFYRYASDTEDMVKMMNELVDDMMARANELSGVTRKFDPSPDYPLNVIVIDELAYLSSMLPDKKLSAEASKALQTLLVLGRATGYMVIGAAQDPRVETLRFRDLFPTRVALRMKAGMVDLALGPGSRAAGALCDMIPDPRNGGAGVAYVLGESSHIPQLVRMTWCPDELIMNTARNLLPPPDAAPQIA